MGFFNPFTGKNMQSPQVQPVTKIISLEEKAKENNDKLLNFFRSISENYGGMYPIYYKVDNEEPQPLPSTGRFGRMRNRTSQARSPIEAFMKLEQNLYRLKNYYEIVKDIKLIDSKGRKIILATIITNPCPCIVPKTGGTRKNRKNKNKSRSNKKNKKNKKTIRARRN
jgi:hypothetical protein